MTLFTLTASLILGAVFLMSAVPKPESTDREGSVKRYEE